MLFIAVSNQIQSQTEIEITTFVFNHSQFEIKPEVLPVGKIVIACNVVDDDLCKINISL